MPKNKGKKKKNKSQNKSKPNKKNTEAIDEANTVQDKENKDVSPIPEIKVTDNLNENKPLSEEACQNQNNEHLVKNIGDGSQEQAKLKDESINEDSKDSFNENSVTTTPVKKKRFSFLRKKMSSSLHNVNTSSNDINLEEMNQPQERGVQRAQSMSTFDREPKSKIPLYKSRSMKKQNKNNLAASTSNVDSTSLVLNPGMDDWRMSGLLNNVGTDSSKTVVSDSIPPPAVTIKSTRDDQKNNKEDNIIEAIEPLPSTSCEKTEVEKFNSESTPQLKDATTNAELYELENEDQVVMIQKLEDVVREKKIQLPEDIISSDWLVLNLTKREIPTF